MQPQLDEGAQTLTIRPTEAARLADVSTRTITRLCCEGKLPAVRIRSSWRINRAAFLELLGGESDGGR